MRLSGIKIAGFKSFVDPSQLPLPSNLTGVVGPNGCGKSNIIDAVRWVLGETSMKNLRSSDMEDVIFNGSKSRKPAGRASVELVFDNSDGTISGPFAAYAEIAVRRELTRDGSSQYFLNGRKCLKRDVTDLFLGTGLGGKNQYAIIEQGMVSRMVEAKPEELRQWLEEAAGISKYKERRRETESRIRQTRENLARLNDLRSELTQRLETLTRQAANAEKYKDFKVQERRLRAEILALRLRQYETQGSEREQAIMRLEAALEAARAAADAQSRTRLAAEVEAKAQAQQVGEAQNRAYEAEAALARLDQNLRHARELKAIKDNELTQIERELTALDEREAREQARLAQARERLQRLEREAAAAHEAEAQAQAAVVDAEDALQTMQRQWDGFTHDAEAPLTQTEAQRVRVQQLERALQQGELRAQRLDQERVALDTAAVERSLVQADTELAALLDELARAEAALKSLDAELTTLRDQRAAADAALHEDRQILQSSRGRIASLETLQQAAMRQDDAELNRWLEQHALSQAPRLAGALQVDGGWEAAVEHVLQGLLQAPLVDDFSSRAAGIEAAPKSGIALVGARRERGVQGLARHVSGPRAVLEALSQVEPVADLAAARARMAALAPGQSLITPDGIWCGRDWMRFPRRGDGVSGVIARTQLLKELKAQAEQAQQRVLAHEQQVGDLRGRMQQAEQQRRESLSRFDQARHRHAQKLAFRQSQGVRLEQMQSRAMALDEERAAVAAAAAEQRVELTHAHTELLSLEQVAAELREQRAQLQQTLQTRRDGLQRARQLLSQAQQRRSQVQVGVAGENSAYAALEQAIAQFSGQRETLHARREQTRQGVAELETPLSQQAGQVDAARAQVEQARSSLRDTRQALEAAERQLASAVQRQHALEQDKEATQERLQAARLEFEGMRAHRESLLEQIAETGFTAESLLEALAEGATLEAWEEQLAGVQRRIDRLGAINLAAIEELEEARAREAYLTQQHDDLFGALETLEDAIRKIDTETKQLFRSTFDRVNAVFVDRFPKLFGGGEASLELTGDDLLNTGVRVMARPPGKRNSTIHLLSGGEKAMTAVALLLALFELTPAPFCLMDEVDAPLDDANVSRYCEVIREMAQNVQFIIITHNKITMELMQQLHGVTMQEPGVSRLVSVDVEQAVEMTTEEGAQA